MENKKFVNKKSSQLRSEGRVSYTVKRSIPLDVVAGFISILLAAAVWFFTA